MFLRVTASNLLKKLRFPSSHSFSFSEKFKLSSSYQTQANGWRVLNHRDHFLWILISGHVAMSLGISSNTVFAEDATTGASSATDSGNGLIGLSKVEDGSIVSNMHTAKWRLFTDKAREFFLQGKLDEAEKLFLSALQEAKEGFGQRDPHVASASNNLIGWLCMSMIVASRSRSFQLSRPDFRLEDRLCNYDPLPPSSCASQSRTAEIALKDTAELYRVRRAFDKAEPLYLEAINILEESFGPDDIRVGTAAHNLGQFYLGERKMEKARLNYERALKIKRRVLGYGHSECADTMYHLGVVLYLQGKERDAEALIQDSIKMLEEGDEGDSTVCIRRLRYLSQMYLKSHRLADAEMVQRKILHIMELSKGWNSLDTVVAAESLALTLQASSNIKDSKELLERCLNARKALLPGDHIQIGGNLLHLAKVAMLDSSQHKKLDVSRAKDDLDVAKDHLHNSIRIARQCLDKLSKQKDRPKKYSAPGDSRKERHAALIILLQSLSTLSSVEFAKQELQETQEGNINLEAQEALLQCISVYKEFAHDKSISDSPEIKNEYLACLKRAQNLLGNYKLDEELANQKGFQKLNQKS